MPVWITAASPGQSAPRQQTTGTRNADDSVDPVRRALKPDYVAHNVYRTVDMDAGFYCKINRIPGFRWYSRVDRAWRTVTRGARTYTRGAALDVFGLSAACPDCAIDAQPIRPPASRAAILALCTGNGLTLGENVPVI